MNLIHKNLNIIEILIGFIIAFIAVTINVNDNHNFENFAMGTQTSPYFAKKNKIPIHIDKINHQNYTNLYKGWESRGGKDVLLILGNSQTHSINQLKNNDHNYVELLSDTLIKHNIDVLCHSMPNANMKEMLYSFSFFVKNFKVKYLVLPACFDDFREDGVREDFFTLLMGNQFMIPKDFNCPITHDINTFIKKNKIEQIESENIKSKNNNTKDLKALNNTPQKIIEKKLNNFLSQHLVIWKKRPELRGKLFTNLYKLRNTALNISAQSKRPKITFRYEKNMSAFKCILKYANKNNIKVLAYIPPIRSDVAPPYIKKEYEQFKNDVRNITLSYENVFFSNLESIVPGKYWGTKESTNFFKSYELDFMHFQYEGHILLYKHLLPNVLKIKNNDI